MKSNCVLAVAQAMGRALTVAEVKNIDARLAKSMRQLATKDPEGWAKTPVTERLNQAAKHAGDQLIAEKALKQAREGLSILAASKFKTHMIEQAARGMNALDALDRTIGFHAGVDANFTSAESWANSIAKDSLRQMLTTIEVGAPEAFGLMNNIEGTTMIVRELFGENTGNADARVAAAEFRKVAEALRQRFNRGGGDIGLLDDWGMPHHHSQLRVRNAAKSQVPAENRAQWVADIFPWINREKYYNEDGTRMNDAQVQTFLGHAWSTIATAGANKSSPGQPRSGGMRANRGNESREIHFKDADSYMAYQAKYGERSLYEVIVGHILGISKDVGMIETYGPNPDALYSFLRDSAAKDMLENTAMNPGKIHKRVAQINKLYNEVAGKAEPPASARLAASFDTLRNWLIASRLGSATITAFSDEATMHLTAKLNNLPHMRLIANELAALNKANVMEERMAMRAGLSLNTALSVLNRYGQTHLGAAWSKRLASASVRVSGLNAMTEARKRAWGSTMMGSVGAIVRDTPTLAALNAADHRVLLSKGITETDFAVWKKAALEDWDNGNDTMLTPESIYLIPDSALQGMGDPVSLREQAATRLLAVVLEEVDVAIIEPGARERAQMNIGQRGTWGGELARSVLLFKSFPWAIIERHWTRGMSLPNKGGKAAYLATMMAATTVLGMVSLQVNEVLQGRDPRNLNPAKEGGVRNWIAAMLKGGSLGLYGDFLFSQTSKHGASKTASLLGPVIGLGEDLLNLTQGNIIELAQGSDTHIGGEVVRFAKSNTPGASLWYAKAGLDHLLFHQLQEYFSPGYLSAMKSRSRREFGQSYWWEPGEVTPDRAPDLEAAVGE